MELEKTQAVMPLTTFKYSNRVILKTILERDDAGVRLIGERAVIGGWVKSSKELRKEPTVTAPVDDGAGGTDTKDVTCAEILQSRIPFIRSIIKAFGGSNYPAREKLEPVAPKPPRPSISILQVSDGSCAASLQVLLSENYFLFLVSMSILL